MVLRAAERHDRRAVGQREEARFLAVHEFLDHHFGAGFAELAAEHVGERGLGLGAGLGDDHALAGGEAVGLEHDGRVEAVERGRGASASESVRT